MKNLKLRWAGSCVSCSQQLPAGTMVAWDSGTKNATCEACTAGPATPAKTPTTPVSRLTIDRGVAGASARRKYQKDSERERRRNEVLVQQDEAWRASVIERQPIIGRVKAAITPKPEIRPESTATRNWAKGADGEELVGPILEACPDVIVLHDRRVPRSKANIDHLVVGQRGIFVIDPKNYQGALECRMVGGLFNPQQRLYVGGRDQTKLIEKVIWQMSEVRKAIGDEPAPIQGVLCFVGANWRRYFTRPLWVQGMPIMWPAKVAEHVSQEGPLSSDEVAGLAERLSKVLKRA